MKFRIYNRTSGQELGTYDGDTETDALDAMARDAGYRDFADACDTVGGDGVVAEKLDESVEIQKAREYAVELETLADDREFKARRHHARTIRAMRGELYGEVLMSLDAAYEAGWAGALRKTAGQVREWVERVRCGERERECVSACAERVDMLE